VVAVPRDHPGLGEDVGDAERQVADRGHVVAGDVGGDGAVEGGHVIFGRTEVAVAALDPEKGEEPEACKDLVGHVIAGEVLAFEVLTELIDLNRA
jgi:hypothetical protein